MKEQIRKIMEEKLSQGKLAKIMEEKFTAFGNKI